MEPTVVSGPLGLAPWEPEQPFPLGFQTVGPDGGGALGPNKAGHASLDFRKGEQEQPAEPPGALGGLLAGQPAISQANAYLQGLTFKDTFDGLDELSDSALSWLFSPALTEAMGKPPGPAPPAGSSNGPGVQGDLPSSPSSISRRSSGPGEEEPFLLVDLSDGPPGLAQAGGGEPADPPPSPSRTASSPETRETRDQVTCAAVTRCAAEQSPPESRLSTPGLDCGAPLVLLDSPVPDGVAPADVPIAPSQDNGSLALGPWRLTVEEEEDACLHDGPAGDPPGGGSVDLMENQNCSVAKTESSQREMALDLCPAAEDVRDEDSWDSEEQEAVKGGEERPTDPNPPGEPDSGGRSPQAPLSGVGGQAVDTRPEDASPLKAVFDALDQDGDGFVRIEEFMAFAAAYGADQVKDLTKFLDPSGLGVISFEDFHRGISAISNGGPEPQLYSYSPGDGAAGCPEEYDEQNEVTDSAYLGSESTYSECETFTDEDTGALVPPEMHEEVETDSGIEATLHDPEDGGSRFSLSSELHSHSLVTVISGEEEHFEDFGESNTSELLETSVEGSMGGGDSPLAEPAEQVNGSSVVSPSAPASLPDCFQSFLREEALDFFCSQCHKQISRLEDLSTRLNFLEMTSAGKRLSSKKVARHLLQNSSMTLDTMSDLTRDILELADNDITDKVLLLERRVAELEKESEASGEQHARLRQENLQLVHRANALEEQLKEQEVQADEELQQESRRHKEALSKLEREKGLELENLQARLQQLDDENSELRSCVPCLRANIERLEEEKRKLQDEVETASDRLNEETEARRKMADKLSHERHQNQKEKENTQELIEDLRKQLEHLQLYKLEAEAKRGRTPGAGLQEYQSRTREAELEQEIRRLKQDNRTLKEQNDELNGQIINLSIQGAKNLMSASFSDSLAAEISSVSRAELMEAVHKQEEINYRLQDYIDKIIVAIMESNPSILEVK
ncbi:rab11 family-interacting protein 3 [Fundulus heteroclitus]|uniref:rab11 family-interacting protein 3 n=1 Tax=Fundulus heteroclitus TaxID=8078 RepID=UPI00165A30D4|nr:rab11 family-interacting protein 3 [Fundulus heteroclitus]